MLNANYPRLAFVDLETTGGAAAEDRITEVGIIEVDEGGVREWSSLVNPLMPIPAFIQSLTGISNEMVEQAPTFAELADEIHARLDDRVFIAHNARFDHGFLRNEFRRTGHEFRPHVLCTVRLSRKLFPEFARHNLDALAERHRLRVSERHRALGDAQLIWQFWQKIHEAHEPERIDAALSKLVSRPAPPPAPDNLRIDALPSSHGVYLFYGENDMPLYIGKANNLKRQVSAHFSGGNASSKELQISRQTRRIEWVQTAGEIGAQLHEAALIKTLKPMYNEPLSVEEDICSWRLVSRNGTLQPVLAHIDDLFFAHDPQLYGLFAGAHHAKDVLTSIAETHSLCRVVLGLEKPRGRKACAAAQSGQCLGACTDREQIESHNGRLTAALQDLRLQPWPYDGPIGVRENGAIHVIDSWAYLGTANSTDEITVLLGKGQQRFERSVYQIVQNWLPRLGQRIMTL
ncbi:MAG: polymerase subunit epsilon [Burkholderiales bacterium]|jgi:DNA polymerase-3 subunit epsilon